MVENTDSGDTGLLVTLSDSEATTISLSEGRTGGVRISPLPLTRPNRSDKYILYRASDLLTCFTGFRLDGGQYTESQPTSSASLQAMRHD
jgi:hypothetical protein